MMAKSVLVIGGTGKTGTPLVAQLIERGIKVRSATRSGTAPEGAEGARFDWYDMASWDDAVRAIDSVYLMAPLGSHDPVAVVGPFVDRAMAAGVTRFALLSSSLIQEGGPAQGLIHALLRERAPEWTSLRPSWFMQNFINEPHLSSIRTDDAVYSATEDGLVPFIATEDIAAAAAAVLTSEQRPPEELLLTGPQAISYDQVAATIGEARGKPVRHVRLTVRELAARHHQFGVPADFAALLAGLDGLIARGADARTTSDLTEITGSAGSTFEAFAKRNAQIWKA